MQQQYTPLKTSNLSSATSFHQPAQIMPEKVTLASAAVDVMTDLKKIMAVFIPAERNIDTAKQRMIKHGVRLLLVIDDHNCVVGLITATDILGEKPMQFIQKHGGKREDILVKDIMTPREKLEVLSMEDVSAAKVGNLVATLERSGRQHALVVDRDADLQKVRGIFSLTQIARQLGVQLETHEIVRTFAEIHGQLGS
ncbi:MAG: CBS domain-containing protein [Sulfuricella sp.]|nr:CBS domain-containing protein [Sulfuricella sp.]